MPANRTPLFVRLPQSQAAALDRLADRTGRAKQHLVSELLAERLRPDRSDLAVGRVEVSSPPDVANDQVLTLDEVSALLKLPVDAVQARAEAADLPGRRFGTEWRFSRNAVLSWLASGERQKRTRNR
jgi:excisionase family DNA binding protein